MGSSRSSSSTLPDCTKTFAFGFATTTRGGPAIRPEGEAAGAPVTGGAAVAPLAPKAGAGIESELRWGKRGFVFAAGGAPVTGGAATRLGGSAVGGTRKEELDEPADPIEPEEEREMLLIGLVMAVDQAGGTAGGGVTPGGRIAAGFIGNVVAAEMFGRAGGVEVTAGLSGRGGKAIRRVSRLGGFCSEFSDSGDSGGVPASAMGDVFIDIAVNVQWRSW